MIAQELEIALHRAFVDARTPRHEFITPEHLLLALLDTPTAAEVLRAAGANMDELRKNLAQHITEQTPRIAADRDLDTQPTLGFQRVIQRAILHVQSTGAKEVTGADVLVALFGERDSHAVYFLKEQGLDRRSVLNQVVRTGPAREDLADEEVELIADGSRQIVLFRDDRAPVEFIVQILQDFLQMGSEEATEVAQEARRQGKAVCGLYPQDVAEFVVQQIQAYARKRGYPLRFETALQD